MKKFFTILRYAVVSIIILILLAVIALQMPPVQNWMAHTAAKKLSKNLGVEVSVGKVSFSFLDKMNMEKILIRDKKKDTLLYAGLLNVRITDWFIFKDNAELKYIGLEDAVINLNRKDSVWNYQFMVDYFSSSSSQKNKKQSNFKLDLKKLNFKNISFINKDDWIGEIMAFKVSSLVVNADSINLSNKIIRINDINLVNPVFELHDYDGLEPQALLSNEIDSVSSINLNPGGLDVKILQTNLANGSIIINSNPRKPLPYFDGGHIYITKLNAKFNNTQLIKDTLKSKIILSAKERSGFEIKHLTANYKLTPHLMEFADLDAQTNKSKLGSYYAMKFKSFNYDFNDYINRVTMVSKLRNSEIHSDDIAFFAPELKLWNDELIVNGDFTGTVNNYNVNNFLARNNSSTSFVSCNFFMKGLPYINTTFINVNNATVKTNYNDVAAYVPSITKVKMPNLPALGNIFFKGNYAGTLLNFGAQGTVSTDLGAIAANVNMQLPQNGDISYNGTVTTDNFNIGKFIVNNQLGCIDFTGKISGTNFELEKIKTTLDGNFSCLQFNNYNYSNIDVNGAIQKKYFNGEVNASDSNLDFKSHVEIDLSKDTPAFNILGDIHTLNLKQLNFYKSNISLTALVDMNFTANNIDNFSGFAKLLNVNIKNSKQSLLFDSLTVLSGMEDNKKFLQISGNEFYSFITGDFKILDLPNNFQFFLSKYYPVYFSPPDTALTKQDFTFKVSTNNISPYLQMFDSSLSGFNYANLSGNVDTKNNIFNLLLNLPEAQYNKYAVRDAVINGTGNADTLKLNSNISSVQPSDSLNFPNSQLNIISSNNYSNVSLKTSANNTFNEADLNADVYMLSNKGLKIHFNPSSFILNDKQWQLEKQGEILITEDEVSAQNVKFLQGFQEIVIETDKAETNLKNNLIVRLKNVVLGDITNLFFKDPKLEGLTNGEIHLHDFFGNFNVEARLQAQQFRMNEDSIGEMNINGNYNYATGYVRFGVTSPNSLYNFNAEGYYNVKDSTFNPLNTTLHLNHTRINLLKNYLSDVFTYIDGFATGDITVKGDPKMPDILGNVKLEKAKLQIDYTKVPYTIDSANISFQENGIDFGNMKIKDTLLNTATLSGKLYEKSFKNMRFDFNLSTNKLLLFNTKASDNPLFYGNATGKADLSLKGPLNNCKLSIAGRVNDSSHIYIPMSESKENGQADFIVFKQYGTEIQQDSLTEDNNSLNLSVDLDIQADNRTVIDVILDPLTGDILRAAGNGRLKIKAGTSEPFSMVGKYNIENGSYNFNFQSLIRKPFLLRPDAGNYIEWTGDPFNANIHVEAQYTAENVSMSDLVGNSFKANSTSGNSVNLYRGPVYVIAILTDKLSKPTINFKFDFPQGSSLKSDPDFAQFINNIEHDNNEMLKQVSYLLVFNTFAPYGNNSSGNSYALNISTIGTNTISQMVTKFMNATVAKALADAFHDKRLQFDFGASAYSSNNLISGLNGAAGTSNNIDRARFNLKVGYKLFNDKVIVSFGGDLDVGASNIPTQWLPDLTVEFILSQDNKLRGMVFSKNSLDYSTAGSSGAFGKRTRQGIGLSYKKDFNRLLGKNRLAGKKEDEIEVKSSPEKE